MFCFIEFNWVSVNKNPLSLSKYLANDILRTIMLMSFCLEICFSVQLCFYHFWFLTAYDFILLTVSSICYFYHLSFVLIFSLDYTADTIVTFSLSNSLPTLVSVWNASCIDINNIFFLFLSLYYQFRSDLEYLLTDSSHVFILLMVYSLAFFIDVLLRFILLNLILSQCSKILVASNFHQVPSRCHEFSTRYVYGWYNYLLLS